MLRNLLSAALAGALLTTPAVAATVVNPVSDIADGGSYTFNDPSDTFFWQASTDNGSSQSFTFSGSNTVAFRLLSDDALSPGRIMNLNAVWTDANNDVVASYDLSRKANGQMALTDIGNFGGGPVTLTLSWADVLTPVTAPQTVRLGIATTTDLTPIPLPPSILMLGAAMAGLGVVGYRRRRMQAATA